MRIFVLLIILVLHSSVLKADERLFNVPTVNQFFVKAYFESESDKESNFWIGTATARCVAAAELAETMNRGLEELAGDARKGNPSQTNKAYIWQMTTQRTKLNYDYSSGYSQTSATIDK